MKINASLLTIALLGACATTPEPCTPEWVEWRSEKVLKRFAFANRSEVNRLRKFSKTLQADDIAPLTALQIPVMVNDFRELSGEFEDSVLPELNATVDQCGSIQQLSPALTTFLREEGVGEDVLEWVELLTVIAVDSQS